MSAPPSDGVKDAAARTPAADPGMRRRRGPSEPLTRARIVETALAIVDAEGLEALSMRRLGRALDADATAIYYYLPNKDALYDAITDAAIGELGDIEESPTDGPFEEFLVAVGRSYHTTLMRHPRALRLLTSSPFHTGTTMTSAELVLGRMLELGLTPDQALAAFGTFGRYVLGAVNTYAQHLLGDEYHIDRPADEVLAELPAERFPNARLVMRQGRFMGFEGEFEFGLRVFARGLEITARQ